MIQHPQLRQWASHRLMKSGSLVRPTCATTCCPKRPKANCGVCAFTESSRQMPKLEYGWCATKSNSKASLLTKLRLEMWSCSMLPNVPAAFLLDPSILAHCSSRSISRFRRRLRCPSCRLSRRLRLDLVVCRRAPRTMRWRVSDLNASEISLRVSSSRRLASGQKQRPAH